MPCIIVVTRANYLLSQATHPLGLVIRQMGKTVSSTLSNDNCQQRQHQQQGAPYIHLKRFKCEVAIGWDNNISALQVCIEVCIECRCSKVSAQTTDSSGMASSREKTTCMYIRRISVSQCVLMPQQSCDDGSSRSQHCHQPALCDLTFRPRQNSRNVPIALHHPSQERHSNAAACKGQDG